MRMMLLTNSGVMVKIQDYRLADSNSRYENSKLKNGDSELLKII